MIDYYTIIPGVVIVFLAGITHGLTGFGFALVSVPLLVIFLPPRVAIAVVLMLTILTPIPILIEAKKWLDIKRILPLILAGIAGMPFGTYLLLVLPSGVLKIIIGVVVTLFAIAFFLGFKKKVKFEKYAMIPVGVFSGLLHGAVSMNGPPVVLFFSNQGMMKQAFRVNLVFYFFVLNIATFIAYIISGLVTLRVITLSLVFIPAMVIGVIIGIVLVKKVREILFRKIVLVIIIVSGILAITSGFKFSGG